MVGDKRLLKVCRLLSDLGALRLDSRVVIEDLVYLKMITFKGRVRISGEKETLPKIPRFRIIKRVGKVAYKLELPTAMDAFHNVFHVSQLRKCLTDQEVIVPEIPSDLGTNLTLVHTGRPKS